MDENETIGSETTDGIDRREFTLRSLLAMLGGVTITISGCGGGGGGSPTQPAQPTPQPSGGDKTGNVSANHGHTAVIRAAQLAGGAFTLDIRGDADHPHTVQLTAAEIASIAAGQRVGKGSSEDAFHTHTVTFN